MIIDMLTEKDYCDYDTCVALREIGFPIEWFEDETYHENNTEISLYEAQKFLREEKHLFVEIQYRGYTWPYGYEIYNSNRERLDVVDGYQTYEDALSEGIKEAVKILKDGEK